jgi:hypothetical protein
MLLKSWQTVYLQFWCRGSQALWNICIGSMAQITLFLFRYHIEESTYQRGRITYLFTYLLTSACAPLIQSSRHFIGSRFAVLYVSPLIPPTQSPYTRQAHCALQIHTQWLSLSFSVINKLSENNDFHRSWMSIVQYNSLVRTRDKYRQHELPNSQGWWVTWCQQHALSELSTGSQRNSAVPSELHLFACDGNENSFRESRQVYI